MGCGQSKIHLYPRKSKSKANGKKTGHADSDAETDEDEGHIEDIEKCQNRERENDDTDEQSNRDATDGDIQLPTLQQANKNVSLLQSQEISTSQQNFFRMLDKKIEEGPDYDSNSETEIALEEARLNALVQHWESASLTASICSSASRSLQTTPIRQPPIKQLMPSGVARAVLQNTLPLPLTPQQQQQQFQLQQQQQQTQQLLTADFLPHGATQQQLQQQQQQQQQQTTIANQQQIPLQLPAGSLKAAQQQVLLAAHMNTKMLHHPAHPALAVVPVSITDPAVAAAAAAINANSSNAALAMLQATPSHSQQQQQQQQQLSHMLSLSSSGSGLGGGSPQLLGKSAASPKRLLDTRVLMNPPPPTLAQQMQTQLQAAAAAATQYMPATGGAMMLGTNYVNGGGGVTTLGGGRSPSQNNMQMAYFTSQPTPLEQQQLQLQQQHQQQQQQQHQQQQQQQQLTPPTSSQGQMNPQAFYGDVIQSVQAPTEYKFPPAISVQRLAPQVQRQLRETQELIKDSCPQLYAAGYGSPGPPIRNQTRNPNRRPTLETQFSQELS